jgi:hypothetical protein
VITNTFWSRTQELNLVGLAGAAPVLLLSLELEWVTVLFVDGCVLVDFGDRGDKLLALALDGSGWFWMTLDVFGDGECPSLALGVDRDLDNSLSDARRGNLTGADVPCCISGRATGTALWALEPASGDLPGDEGGDMPCLFARGDDEEAAM